MCRSVGVVKSFIQAVDPTHGDMAAIPGLDDDQVDAIIAYIRSEQERQGFER